MGDLEQGAQIRHLGQTVVVGFSILPPKVKAKSTLAPKTTLRLARHEIRALARGLIDSINEIILFLNPISLINILPGDICPDQNEDSDNKWRIKQQEWTGKVHGKLLTLTAYQASMT